jgi:hypothetical protein
MLTRQFWIDNKRASAAREFFAIFPSKAAQSSSSSLP